MERTIIYTSMKEKIDNTIIIAGILSILLNIFLAFLKLKCVHMYLDSMQFCYHFIYFNE